MGHFPMSEVLLQPPLTAAHKHTLQQGQRHTSRIQGYLAHEQMSPRRNLQKAFAYGPREFLGGGQFLMSKVPLYLATGSGS